MIYVRKNFINGQWINSDIGETYKHRSPANLTEVTGTWPKSTIQDVNNAISSAQKAFKSWSKLTVYQRAEYLRGALRLMQERSNAIAKIITIENGKTISESKSEIASAIKEMEFQINEGIRLGGQIKPSAQDGVFAYETRVPLGVVGVISPWNFPFNVPSRKITPALITGNTCILKPAKLTPGAGAAFVKLFDDAGLPKRVLNFLTGSGAVIGQALVDSPSIKAITFTGSTDVGMEIHKSAAENLTRTQLEMGGKNPLVILADADLEKAASAAVLAAFACAGQWCTSTSRVIVEKDVHDKFVDLVLEKIKKIKVGKGISPETNMGPVCGQDQLKNVLNAIEKGKAEGAQILTGGKQMKQEDLADGCFVEPTIFTNVTPEMFIAQEEIFGPVLSIIKVDNFEQAIDIANNVKFGLSSSVYTSDLKKALTFVEKTDVGLTHVNIPTAVKEPQFSFGGVKLSGSGIPEAGSTGVEFFTEHKVAYIKYN